MRGSRSASARSARLLDAQLSTMARGTQLVLDARGFSRMRVAISSDSSGSTVIVSRVPTMATTSAPSTGHSYVDVVTGSSVGASTSLTLDWPYYMLVMSTGSTGTCGGWVSFAL